MTNIPKATLKALSFLEAQQQPDGGFLSYSSQQQAPFRQRYRYRTTFGPAVILAALSHLKSEPAVNIQERLSRWLLQQKSPHWSFNYWAVDVPERSTMPYPDDLDDTACAFIGLYLSNKSLVSSDALASIVKLLIAVEVRPGGPYRTWLVPATSDKIWLDVDIAVNSNIAYLLSLISNPLPNLTSLIEKAITNKALRSPYYPSEYPVLYYVARAYDGTLKKVLAQYILNLRQADGLWETPLQTALAVSALSCLGYTRKLEDAVAYLLSQQRRNGSWGAEAFCLDPAREGRQYFSGSAALTTALALEALALYENSKQTGRARSAKRAVPSDQPPALYREAMAAARKQLHQLDAHIHRPAFAVLKRLTREQQGEEIVTLPHLFYRSLKHPRRLNKPFFVELGLANLYGWLAYTIYDDFLDDEGDAKQLSAANVAIRYSLQAFERALPNHPQFQALVSAIFERIDSANAWEVHNCRFKVIDEKVLRVGKLPEYRGLERLAERSLGHTLTPMAVLAACKVSVKSADAGLVQTALQHYLIARQLNDDLHDWEADVVKGHITYVVREIFADLRLKPTAYRLQHLLPKMRQIFWHQTVLDVCQTIDKHSTFARKATLDSGLLKTHSVITDLLDGIDATNNKTRLSVAQAKDFLKSYSSNDTTL